MITINSLNMISMNEPDRGLQELSGVGIEYPCSSLPLGGSKILVLDGLWVVLKLEWNPLHPRTPPLEATAFLAFLSTSIGPSSSASAFILVFSLCAHNCCCLSSVFDLNGSCSHNTITL